MIERAAEASEPIVQLLLRDPVRPDIPPQARLGKDRDVFIMRGQDAVNAVTCVSYQQTVPATEAELFEQCDEPNIAVFYSLWSYTSGSGRQLLFNTALQIKKDRPAIRRFVTMSPLTLMARGFHLSNGATLLRENPKTVNFEYLGL